MLLGEDVTRKGSADRTADRPAGPAGARRRRPVEAHPGAAAAAGVAPGPGAPAAPAPPVAGPAAAGPAAGTRQDAVAAPRAASPVAGAGAAVTAARTAPGAAAPAPTAAGLAATVPTGAGAGTAGAAAAARTGGPAVPARRSWAAWITWPASTIAAGISGNCRRCAVEDEDPGSVLGRQHVLVDLPRPRAGPGRRAAQVRCGGRSPARGHCGRCGHGLPRLPAHRSGLGARLYPCSWVRDPGVTPAAFRPAELCAAPAPAFADAPPEAWLPRVLNRAASVCRCATSCWATRPVATDRGATRVGSGVFACRTTEAGLNIATLLPLTRATLGSLAFAKRSWRTGWPVTCAARCTDMEPLKTRPPTFRKLVMLVVLRKIAALRKGGTAKRPTLTARKDRDGTKLYQRIDPDARTMPNPAARSRRRLGAGASAVASWLLPRHPCRSPVGARDPLPAVVRIESQRP